MHENCIIVLPVNIQWCDMLASRVFGFSDYPVSLSLSHHLAGLNTDTLRSFQKAFL